MFNTVDSLPPYCYPIEIKVDIIDLIDSVLTLLERLDTSLDKINQQCNQGTGYAINLTHLPHLSGNDRWNKYTEHHPAVAQQGVKEYDFTSHLAESQDLLIGKIIHKIYAYHQGKFQGRAQLVWLGPKKSYNFHRDPHTPNRYHIPIITNEKCFWLLKNDSEQIYKIHMPADGRIWYLDPNKVMHDFKNESEHTRLHLLLTSGF